MTPEERARNITFPPGRGADFADALRVKIANAIRAAVEEERERCAQAADSYAQTMKLADRERMVAAWVARDIRKPETD
jgi:hypothetical protein